MTRFIVACRARLSFVALCALTTALAACAPLPSELDEVGKQSLASTRIVPVVGPLLSTRWGQSGAYQNATPLKDGERTYPGCTTISSAQVLYYYRYQSHATSDVCYGLEHAPLSGPDVVDGHTLCVPLSSRDYDWDAMSPDLTRASAARVAATAGFIYDVGVSLHAQYGGDEGTSATGKQIENAFRLQWGYASISRRRMSVISRDAFGYSPSAWADLIRGELDAGRPVLYMALQEDADVGHSFVIDGYATNGLVHVNWGWGGRHDGWYDPNTLEDPTGRRWIRDAMIFRGLEPTEGYAAAMRPSAPTRDEHVWQGAGSLVSLTSGTRTGYGLTQDEAAIAAHAGGDSVVFFQWEIDARDGRRLELASDAATHATITFGDWSSRAADRTYHDVSLPFVLDPSSEGLSSADGEFYVIAVALDPGATGAVTARSTSAAASSAASVASAGVLVDGHLWNGNASLISLASGTATGYGLTTDEARIHPGDTPPIVFFQWELDGRDGRRLRIEGAGAATLRYGTWNDRERDVTRAVTLPFVIDPAADGLASADGEYLVISLAFDRAPSAAAAVVATVER